jgi:GH18 family chitinase
MTPSHLVCCFCASTENNRIIVNPPLLCIAAKGQFIEDAGLAGFAMWEAGGDSDDILLDAIKSAVGST